MRIMDTLFNLVIGMLLFAAFVVEAGDTEEIMKIFEYVAAAIVVVGAALSVFPTLVLFNFRWFYLVGSAIFCYTSYKQQQWPWLIVNGACIFFYIVGAVLMFV